MNLSWPDPCCSTEGESLSWSWWNSAFYKSLLKPVKCLSCVGIHHVTEIKALIGTNLCDVHP